MSGSHEEELARLRAQNAALQRECDRLNSRFGAPAEQGPLQAAAGGGAVASDGEATAVASPASWDGLGHGLTKDQIARYSRQIVLHSFGVQAQSRLCLGSVLIIGAGGLGSPAALYLAAAGVGRLGLLDRDEVELSNIHRQVIHTEASVGVHKAVSAARACRALNSSIQVETHLEALTPANAVQLVRQYDVILDASDNAPTRYLISDACCAAGRPLVSGAAIGTDGQLTVYCHGDDGPCYRCLFPEAPAAGNCARCVDAGVLGVVPGIIGTLQALEAVKLLSGVGEPLSRRLLVADLAAGRFHAVKLRAKSPACVACGSAPAITAASLPQYDYTAFTGQAAANDAAPLPLQLIPWEERITPAELQQRLASEPGAVLVDVRPAEQYNICHLPGAVHAPYKHFSRHLDAIQERLAAAAGVSLPPPAAAAGQQGQQDGGGTEQQDGTAPPPPPLYVVCRRGNDSQRAVAALRAAGISHGVDVMGGMEGWAREVDQGFPTY
ncbi:Adenylyltransferase and sulfurtransferase MOCS3 [Micractinium conductrix]|uniref:Adenylyltransferase and sulfurtransferase MOCS3 n=1 Tax=Micractinium conductrix TaxID=554055 RepID=A0A2P6V9C7_9CHLO|nr:Adenylyltransferase and sulfurtransferase MOCS3 [Micractinium conductrix]|eukprot:PSC70689.1 Adenylyltransferase and sulfurtransferase MOCS3 [Micractinium conductrix]